MDITLAFGASFGGSSPPEDTGFLSTDLIECIFPMRYNWGYGCQNKGTDSSNKIKKRRS